MNNLNQIILEGTVSDCVRATDGSFLAGHKKPEYAYGHTDFNIEVTVMTPTETRFLVNVVSDQDITSDLQIGRGIRIVGSLREDFSRGVGTSNLYIHADFIEFKPMFKAEEVDDVSF